MKKSLSKFLTPMSVFIIDNVEDFVAIQQVFKANGIQGLSGSNGVLESMPYNPIAVYIDDKLPHTSYSSVGFYEQKYGEDCRYAVKEFKALKLAEGHLETKKAIKKAAKSSKFFKALVELYGKDTAKGIMRVVCKRVTLSADDYIEILGGGSKYILTSIFTFDTTPEGYSYWRNISDSIVKGEIVK